MTRRVYALIAFLAIISSLVGSVGLASADIDHGALVPAQPRADTPRVLDGIVWDTTRWNNMIIVGGDFAQVEQDGAVYDQANLMAYDINTGDLITSFDPQINGKIREVEVAEDGQSLFVGGAFNSVNGKTRKRLAKIRTNGNLVTTFNANVSSEVNGLALSGGKVYVGGSFLKVEGQPRSKMAAVDAITGDLDTTFDLPITGGIGKNGHFSVKALDVTPDGSTLMVVHTGSFVDGQDRAGVALVDLTGPTAEVSTWSTTLYRDWYSRCAGGYLSLRDGEISPDGTYFVVGGKGHDRPPVCDSAIRWPIAGGADLEPDWISRHFDSVYAIAISDHAVYTGGHFRYQEAPGSPDPYPGDQFTTYNVGDPAQVALLGDDIVARDQVGALDPATGKSLDWAPSTNSFGCVCSLTVIDRGLLLGHDRTQIGGITTGREAFFDLGGTTDTVRPTVTISVPAGGSTHGSPAQFSGTASDNVGVAKMFMSIRSRNGLGWLRRDGSFGNYQKIVVSMDSPGATTTGWSAAPVLPDGDFRIYLWAEDPAGNRTNPKPKAQFLVSTGADTGPPSVSGSADTTQAAGEVAIAGTASDDQSVIAVQYTVKDLATGLWLQPDSTFKSGWKALPIAINSGPSVNFTHIAALPAGDYKMRFIATDSAGKKNPLPRTPVLFTIN